jgi:hypothetical protein
MYLGETLLPVRDKEGKPFTAEIYQSLCDELTECYGGVTAFTRAPAEGETKAGNDKVHDDIVVFEVMTDNIDRESWRQYRERLERTFEQHEVLVRCHDVREALAGRPGNRSEIYGLGSICFSFSASIGAALFWSLSKNTNTS